MKYYEMIALRTFFRNGELIIKGEIVDCDKESRDQMIEEELMEYTKVQKVINKEGEK